MVKIREYGIIKKTPSTFGVTLPPEWIHDLKLKQKDRLEIYRDEEDKLIIIPVKRRKS